MELVRFFGDHKKKFTSLWILAQCEAARTRQEVGCERFFSLSGYVSSARRTQLNVRTYERLAMLAAILLKVYVDVDWVSAEYLKRCKNGTWKKESDEEALKCWNLERIIIAELEGKPHPEELTMDDLLNEGLSTLQNKEEEDEVVVVEG